MELNEALKTLKNNGCLITEDTDSSLMIAFDAIFNMREEDFKEFIKLCKLIHKGIPASSPDFEYTKTMCKYKEPFIEILRRNR